MKPKGVKNTEKIRIHTQYFEGGMSVDEKVGVPNSYWRAIGFDNRTIPSQLKVFPGYTNISDTLGDLITAMDQDTSGNRWGIGANGTIFKIDTTNTISTIGTLNSDGAAGILYNAVTDQLYIPGEQTVSMYGQLVNTGISGPSQLRLDQFKESASNSPGCTNLYDPASGFWDGIARDTATQTYTTPLAISETVGNFCAFAPDIEPFYSINVWIVNKGTGNWTLTLHDSQNNVLGSVTKTNASLSNNAYNEFKFPAPGVRALVSASQTGTSATYHFHITSTVADGTVQTVDLASLEGAKMLVYAYRMVKTNNGWHPTTLFTGAGIPLMCIGNGPYLSTYDFSNDADPTNQQWQRHALTFRPGEEVCGLTTNNQYLVIAVEKRSTDSTRRFQKGALYFWDGSSYNPNFVIDVPMGAPYSVFTFNNITYFMCAGSLYAWSGGQTVIKVRKIAYQNTDYLGAPDKTIVNPNMMASRYNILMMGYPSSTSSTEIYYGTYSWGAVELTFPNSMVISTGLSNGIEYASNTNQLQIGCVYNFVDSMYQSWSYYDGVQTIYGLDVIDNNSKPTTVARYESLIFDGGVRYKMKRALRLKINFLDLPTGVTVTPLWSLDRGAWQSVDPITGQSFAATTGDNSLMVELNNARFHEIQWGFYVTCDNTATEPAVITGVTMEVDPLVGEQNMKRDDD